MVSAMDRAKRALVTLLKLLATAYSCVVDVSRDSSELTSKTILKITLRRYYSSLRTAMQCKPPFPVES